MKHTGNKKITNIGNAILAFRFLSWSWEDKINGGMGEKNIFIPLITLSANPKAPIWLVVRKKLNTKGQPKDMPDPKIPLMKIEKYLERTSM